MRDVELYQQIVGLEQPWSVQEVELNIDEGRVDIHVEHPEGQRWNCPHCARELSCYDHSPERTWRHLDTCQLETHLHARIPRVQCPEHGVVQVAVPWAEERGRFTLLMERFIIQGCGRARRPRGPANCCGSVGTRPGMCSSAGGPGTGPERSASDTPDRRG